MTTTVSDNYTTAGGLSARLGSLDSPHAAAILVISAVLILAGLRKGFGGINVRIGD
jgi:hypothetical protein